MALSKEVSAALQSYRALMVEAKARVMSINALTNDQRGIPSPLVREYGALQIRMICEIIALGCLVAHGDLVEKAPRRLRDAFKPGEIFVELEKLHDSFFPCPIRPEKTETGWHMAEYNGPPYATKADVREIWAQCGNILHRGNLKRVIKERTQVQANFADISGWGRKLMNLLSNHSIMSFDRRIVFIALLAHGEEVQVVIGEAVPFGGNRQ